MRRFFAELFTPILRIGTEAGPIQTAGSGSPEGVLTAPIGSIYMRTDGGTGTTTYRKESGVGNTGWVAASNGGGGSSLLTENIQSGTTYTFLATDVDKMVTATGASPVFTLPLNAVTPITVYSQGAFRHKGTGVARFQITGAGIIDGKTAGFVSVLPGQQLQYWKTATDTWETVISAPNPYAIAAVFAADTFNL